MNRRIDKVIAFGMLGLLFSLTATAAPVQDKKVSLKSLNSAIEAVLAPLQNAFTKATVQFDRIEFDKERTLAFKATGLYSKAGRRGEFAIVADEVSYDYDKLVNPVTVVKGAIKGDLRLLMEQKEINGFLAELEPTIDRYAAQFTADYGDAATVTARVENKTIDANGDYVSIEGKIEAALDYGKLPNNKRVKDEMWSSLSAKFKISVKEGIALDVRLVSNPKYIGFEKDQTGLKEYLVKLLDQDPDLLAQLGVFIAYLDRYATDLVK